MPGSWARSASPRSAAPPRHRDATTSHDHVSASPLATATEPRRPSVLSELGLAERKPFYTVDLQYLWGRLLGDSVIFGSGLVFPGDWRNLADIDVTQGQPEDLLAILEKRIHGFHPALHNVKFTHRRGGPLS